MESKQYNSHADLASNEIAKNGNIIEILSQLNKMATTDNPTISFNIYDDEGNKSMVTMPSMTYIKTEIDRLNKNINSMSNVDNSSGSIVKTENGTYKKIISVNLNKEPKDLNTLNIISEFNISKNWFFDSLINPQMTVDINLNGKIENNINKCLVRRYLLKFESDNEGLTYNGQNALESFNSIFRGKSDIYHKDLEKWIRETQGLLNREDLMYEENIFRLEPNILKYTGLFSVLKVEEDSLNKKMWFHLNQLTYVDNQSSETKNLAVGDYLTINSELTSTKYKIDEISVSKINPRITVTRVEGNDVIPVGIETLKIHSDVVYNKNVRLSIGYDEHIIVFIKPLNDDGYILSNNWSKGVGFWTKDLKLSSNDMYNGSSMERYYTSKVDDYGLALKDLVSKKIPSVLGETPNTPFLIETNFKIVQINKHLTDNNQSELLRDKNIQKKTLKSEIEQLNESIKNKNKQKQIGRFTSEATKNQFENELDKLNKTKESKTKLLSSIVSDILDLSKTTNTENPKFRIRGFWAMPKPIISKSTEPQQVIQFKIQYRYLSKSNKESNIETFNIDGSNKTGIFSNWVTLTTNARDRIYNSEEGRYIWAEVDESNINLNNINQLDIPINPDENVEIRVKSVSEVGYPEALLESQWSNIITLTFPEELSNQLNDNDSIFRDALKEELIVDVNSDLTSKGIFEHISSSFIEKNVLFKHTIDEIYSGYKDDNGNLLNMLEYVQLLTNRIKDLESIINKVKGELEVIVYRNSEEYIIKNNSEIEFIIECEDYLDRKVTDGSNNDRTYLNDIYLIKDFLIKIRNKSSNSTLGLLSSKRYINSDFYDENTPQVFWVNEKNELLYNNSSGRTKTHLNNQFLWMVNYDDSTSNNTDIIKLSSDINFVNKQTTNSLVEVLSSPTYNLGYLESGSPLTFNGNNTSLLEQSKWFDDSNNITSSSKLLSTIHPVVKSLNELVETSSNRIKNITNDSNDDIIVPINIYFKMNAMDNSKKGTSNEHVKILSNLMRNITHTKKIKFFVENENENRPFQFTIKFILNRNKMVLSKSKIAVSDNIFTNVSNTAKLNIKK